MSSKLKVNNIIPSTGTQIGISTTGGGINLLTGTVVTGIVTASGFDGPITQSGDFTIDDYIVHAGDTDTKLGFPSADAVDIFAGGKQVRLTSDGNLGIGTAAPGQKVHLTATSGDGYFRADTNVNGGLLLYVQGIQRSVFANDSAFSGTITDTGIGAKGNLIFRTGTSSFDERLRITSAGKVGIGTDNPAHLLHLEGSSPVIQFEDSDNAANIYSLINAAGSAGRLLFQVDPANAGTDSYVRFDIDGDERLRIDNTGKVGINRTTTLVGLLDVKGVNDDSIKFSASSYGGGHLRITGEDRTPSGTAGPYGHTIRFKTKPQNNNAGNGLERDALILYHEGWSGLHTASFPKGNVEINDGDLVVASGHGINFAATGNAGSSPSGVSELFNDYETGTFTVTLANSLSVHTQTKLTYTKIGNKCHISGQFRINTGGSDLTINNLPFTTVNTGSTDETFSVGNVGLYYVSMPSDGNASGEIFTKTQKNDNNMYFVYNRHNTDPNSHTATANGYYTISHWYTVST